MQIRKHKKIVHGVHNVRTVLNVVIFDVVLRRKLSNYLSMNHYSKLCIFFIEIIIINKKNKS